MLFQPERQHIERHGAVHYRQYEIFNGGLDILAANGFQRVAAPLQQRVQ